MFLAEILQTVTHFAINKGENHRAGGFLNAGNHPLKLALGTNQGPEFLDRLDMFELGQTSAGQSQQCRTGRIGDEMDVKLL